MVLVAIKILIAKAMALISGEYQLILYYGAHLLLCIVALLGASVPRERTVCLLIAAMCALILYLKPTFDHWPDPNVTGQYIEYVLSAIYSMFILFSIMFVRKNGLQRNLRFLFVVSFVNLYQIYDTLTNPDKSIIDSNYALIQAIIYSLFIISHTGVLRHAFQYHAGGLGRFDLRDNHTVNSGVASSKRRTIKKKES